MRTMNRGKDLVLPTLPDDLTSQLILRLMSLSKGIKNDYLKETLLAKFVSSETDPPGVRRQRAINTWLATEAENEATNDRLLILGEEYNILPRVTIGQFTEKCREVISDIIGDTVPIEALIGSFSGGSSTSRSRARSHPASKYVGKAHVTKDCLDWFVLLEDELPGWFSETVQPLEIEIVPGNVMFTVPKKTDIDRVACKEPDLNMFIQKGAGSFIRKCLRRIGINLNDQTNNQSFARVGSIDGSLATIDLSSASDSVSTELVFQLLPVSWFTFLDNIRCRVTIIDGEEHRNHMFSSMGNGFTFELESLLFYTLARVTAYFTGTRGIVSVYGDDIIVPTVMSKDLTWVLQHYGFQVNPDKSHTSGSFRESCGGHYYDGFDITPFYIREPIATIKDVIHYANSIRQWADFKTGGIFGAILDPEVEETWLWLKSFVPECLWGGVDPTFDYQLASNDGVASRLCEEKKRFTNGLGGYYQWLNATWDRALFSDGLETSSRVVEIGKIRIRKARYSTVTRLSNLWYHEVS